MFFKKIETVVISMLNQAHAVVSPRRNGCNPAKKAETASRLFLFQSFVLYGQATKRIRWMPWQREAKKDVGACDKLRGGGNRPLIRRSLNGETHLS
jgi:hypothetical protein